MTLALGPDRARNSAPKKRAIEPSVSEVRLEDGSKNAPRGIQEGPEYNGPKMMIALLCVII